MASTGLEVDLARPTPAAVRAELVQRAPFDAMEAPAVQWLVERLRLERYERGSPILHPGEPPEHLHFIYDGAVQLEAVGQVPEDRRVLAELVQGECFPLEALHEHRTVFSTFRAKSETWCYELSLDDFEALQERSPVFRSFCEQRSAAFLENSRRVYLAHFAHRDQPNVPLAGPVSALARRPCTCLPTASVRDAVRAMSAEQSELVTVVSEQGAPVGVFGSGDVVHLVAEGDVDLTAPISTRMRPPPSQLAPGDLGHEAALAMVATGRRHVLVVDQGRLTGVLTERDLFTLQRVGLAEVSRSIHHARDLDTLRNAATDVRELAHAMMAQGIAAEPLTRIISTLNDGLCERVVGLATDAAGVDPQRFCWLTFGSEGRLEQTMFSDQDNGIVFDLRKGEKADKVRDELLPLARHINEALASCGFPLCKGNVMAANPECCLSVTEWQRRFGAWIREPTPQAILDATIYFDLRPLYGRLELARSLRAHLVKSVPGSKNFLHLLVQDALERRPPIGFFRDFVVDSGGEMPGTLDLKTSGITPFVDAARIYALANGLHSTNSGRRLREAADAVGLEREDADAWCDAFHFVQVLRLRHQHALARAKRPLHNRIDPYALNPLDRRFLLEALRQAAKLQKKVAGAYGIAGM